MKKRSLLLVLLTAVMLVFAPLAMAAELPLSATVDVSAVVPGDGTIDVGGAVGFGNLADGENASISSATVTVQSNCAINTLFEGQDLAGQGDTIGVTYTTANQNFSATSPLTFSNVGAGTTDYTVSGITESISLADKAIGDYTAHVTVTISMF